MNLYRVKYLGWELPTRVGLGEEATCRVRIRNNSDARWDASGENGQAPVVASYHWVDGRGRYVVFEGVRTPLPRAVSPGAVVDVNMRVGFPHRQGRYVLEVSLLREGIAWFHDKGVDPLRLQISLASDGILAARRFPPRWLQNLKIFFIAPFSTLYREWNLIWGMARRDMVGRYKSTMGGTLWAVFNPLVMIAVYTFLFAFVLQVRFGPRGNVTDFAFYFMCGLLPWMAFSDPVQRSHSVIAENSNFVKRVMFPVEILPINLVVSAFLSSLIGLGIFLTVLILFGHALRFTLFTLPLIMVFQVTFTMGVCWFVASLSVFVRDVGQILGTVLTMWFFLTPIVYPETAVAPLIRSLYATNPFFHVVKAYRAIILEGTLPNLETVSAIAVFGIVAFFLGYAWFRKTQKSFAEVL